MTGKGEIKASLLPPKRLGSDFLKFNFINPEVNYEKDLFTVLENFILKD